MEEYNMKKLAIWLLVLAMAVSMTACGKTEAPQEETPATDDTVTTTTAPQEESPAVTEVSIDALKAMGESDPANFEYMDTPDGSGIEITNYIGEETLVVVPETIDGKTVVSIGRDAFHLSESIKGVRLADTVTIINENAFMSCTNLEVFVCGTSLKSIEAHAFTSCKKLVDIELNEGIQKLRKCFALTGITRIEIPASVEEMLIPFSKEVVIIGEPGSYVEEYVKEYGGDTMTFEAKE